MMGNYREIATLLCEPFGSLLLNETIHFITVVMPVLKWLLLITV